MTESHADRAEEFAAKADEAMWAVLGVMDDFAEQAEQDEWSDVLAWGHWQAAQLAWSKVHAFQGQAQIHATLALVDSMAARV